MDELPSAPKAADTPVARRADGSVLGMFNYMLPSVPRSITRTGKVGAKRNLEGTTVDSFGLETVAREVVVHDGRRSTPPAGLRDEGFQLVTQPLVHIDYYDNDQVLRQYYPECCSLVQKFAGASHVFAFDHNVRSQKGASDGAKLRGEGGSAVQVPAHIVHNDYTLTSAVDRVRQLAKPPKANDTNAPLLNGQPLLPAEMVERALKTGGRFAFINVWRNVRPEPVETNPLALCDGSTANAEDYVTFEIHYADRIGENYFAAHMPRHRWSYFPRMTRDEAILIKQWDSAGALSMIHKGANPEGALSTFSLHSAFVDSTTPPGAPDRESIEVRTVAFFEGPAAKL